MQWRSSQSLSLSKIKRKVSSWMKETSWLNSGTSSILQSCTSHLSLKNTLSLLWSTTQAESSSTWSKSSEKWIKKKPDFTLLRFCSDWSKSMTITSSTEISNHKISWLTSKAMHTLQILDLQNRRSPPSMIEPIHFVEVPSICLLKWSWNRAILFLSIFTVSAPFYMSLSQVFRPFTIQILMPYMKEH